jgi:hypothetical protein
MATTQPSNDTLPPSVPANLHLVQDGGCAEVWLGWTEPTDETDAQQADQIVSLAVLRSQRPVDLKADHSRSPFYSI